MEPFSQSSDFTTPVNTTPPKKSKKGLLMLIIVLLVLGLGGFWFYRGYQTNQKKVQEDVFLTPSAAPVEEASPTPDEKASPSPTGKVKGTSTVTSAKDLRVEVLNGSGEEGVAGKMRDHLTNKGYKTIDVGNAENFDYQGVEVRIKEEYKKYLETIEADIKEAYNLSSDSGKLVTASSDVDVTVIVGK